MVHNQVEDFMLTPLCASSHVPLGLLPTTDEQVTMH